MQLVAHPDPHRLEAEMLERIRALQAAEPAAPALVVVPTRVLADHVRRRLAQRLGSCLGVEVFTPRGLARLIRDDAGLPPARPLPTSLAAALLVAALQELPDGNRWRRFVERRPTARRALLATLRELREAGLLPGQVAAALAPAEAGAAADPDLAALYAAYVRRLSAARGTGLADDADLAADALPHAASWAARFRMILLHGAYELTGCNMALAHALARGAPLTFLMPLEPGAPAYAYAERFAREFILEPGAAPERLADETGPRHAGLLGGRLRYLYDEAARPAPMPAGVVTALHAQGEPAEMTAAVRAALARVAAGRPAAEIAIVARSLSPYAAAIEESLGGEDLPFTSSASMPLRRQPRPHDLMRLLRLAADDFPRAATAQWLASPRIDWRRLGVAVAPPADRADEWSRAAGLLGGLQAWHEDLHEWAMSSEPADGPASPGSDLEAVASLATPLGRAVEILQPDFRRSWSDHAAAIVRLEQGILTPAKESEREIVSAWRRLLDEMTLLDRLLPAERGVPYRRMLDWLEESMSGAGLPLGSAGGGGLRVLDAMQARGLTFDTVLLAGMNSGLVPRPVREDPLLPDSARLRLRQSTGSPLPVKAHGEEEERLILAMVLGAAGSLLGLSWQRAGGDGRTRMPSLALREVARVVGGNPDLSSLVADDGRLPAALDEMIESLAARHGLITPGEARLHAALTAPDPRAARRLLEERAPELAPGLAMLEQLESFAVAPGAFDARIGDAAPLPRRLGVSSVEQLGRCPARYFFGKVLALPEEDPEARLTDLEARDLGAAVHELLEQAYDAVLSSPVDAANRPALAQRLQAELAQRWPGLMRRLLGRRSARLPVLWQQEGERWRAAVADFLAADPVLNLPAEYRGMELEQPLEGAWPGASDPAPRLRGRLDRRLHAAGNVVTVDDYKTGGKLGEKVSVTEMLKLRRLQVPLYHLMSGGAEVRLLGVGPDYQPGGRREDDGRAVFKGFEEAEHRDSFLQSLGTALALLRHGVFPMSPGDDCRYCAFTRACRRQHPPSLERDAAAADTADYRFAGRKSAQYPGGRA